MVLTKGVQSEFPMKLFWQLKMMPKISHLPGLKMQKACRDHRNGCISEKAYSMKGNCGEKEATHCPKTHKWPTITHWLIKGVPQQKQSPYCLSIYCGEPISPCVVLKKQKTYDLDLFNGGISFDGSSPVRDMFTALQIHRLFLVVDVSSVTTSID